MEQTDSIVNRYSQKWSPTQLEVNVRYILFFVLLVLCNLQALLIKHCEVYLRLQHVGDQAAICSAAQQRGHEHSAGNCQPVRPARHQEEQQEEDAKGRNAKGA